MVFPLSGSDLPTFPNTLKIESKESTMISGIWSWGNNRGCVEDKLMFPGEYEIWIALKQPRQA
jgi:hypothetical protein